jgi:4-amino-4-deoxy-L-arabinose transferase-like glycosyltransferase
MDSPDSYFFMTLRLRGALNPALSAAILDNVNKPRPVVVTRVTQEIGQQQQPALLASRVRVWTLLVLIFLAVHFAALFSPGLLDDADAAHAEAAAHMAVTGNWVTPYIDGIRYLEKPPMYYWLAAIDYHLFGFNVFATHLPLALAVLGLAILGWLWGRRAYGTRGGFYAALAVLTTVGVFLFTRFYIPDSILTFFLTLSLFLFLTGLEDRKPLRLYVCYASLGCALLSKGLIAPVFFTAAVVPYLILTGEWKRWREMRLFTGFLVFLAIGAPWHILCGLANPDQGHPIGNIPTFGNVHGFFYFYFINEHFLRFLGTRYPHDYNKQPWWVFWLGQMVWLFPWSLFVPVVLRRAWRNRRLFWSDLRYNSNNTLRFLDPRMTALEASSTASRLRFRARTGLLLGLNAAFILIFFSISTNQEYYTWPAYFSLLMLTAGALSSVEENPEALDPDSGTSRLLNGVHAALAVLGLLIAAALAYGLWSSRHLPYVPDIGALLAHRAVGDYSLSMSHFFDLTTASFAALRFPAILAALTFLVGPPVAWWLRKQGHHLESTVSLGLTTALFLVAAHIGVVRFAPMLSSKPFAETINAISHNNPDSYQLLCYGDQTDCSSVIFYTHHFVAPYAYLVHGKYWYFEPDPKHNGGIDNLFGSTMIWGSDYPDARRLFLSDTNLVALWGHGERKFLVVPGDYQHHIQKLLGGKLIEVQEISDKTLYTDRPLS